MKAVNIADLSDDHAGNDRAATRGGLNGVTLIKKRFHFFFQIKNLVMNINQSF